MIDAETCELFRRAGVATVYEANGRNGDVDPSIRAMTMGLSVAGAAFTVTCEPGDNLALHRAVAQAEKGDVLVVCGHGESFGYLGDILAEAATCRSIAGAVIDGGCRDVAELKRMGFPVWARGLAIRAASKTRPGAMETCVHLGGVEISPGDLIVADDDGVCAVSSAAIGPVLEATQRRLSQEAEIRERLRQGELTLDLLDLRRHLVTSTA